MRRQVTNFLAKIGDKYYNAGKLKDGVVMAKETLQSVERTFQIIELLSERGAMGVRELGYETGLHATVVHRILGTLVQLGYVCKEEETDRYLMTYRLLTVGNGILQRNSIVRLAHPHLEELARQCMETVHFVEKAGNNIRYLDKITPSANMFVTGSYVGMELALASTAVGKAILARLPAKEVERIWEELPAVRFTANTICDLERLFGELEEVRKTGFAYDNEEREEGLFCVGVSIPDYKGAYSYGISISAPLVRMRGEKLEDAKRHLWETREKIMGVIGKRDENAGDL